MNIIMNKIFSIRLKDLRERMNLSQEQFASALGVSRNSIYFYENNKRVPDINTAEAIANFFKVSTDYLLGNEEITFDDVKILCYLLSKAGYELKCVNELWYLSGNNGMCNISECELDNILNEVKKLLQFKAFNLINDNELKTKQITIDEVQADEGDKK